CAWCRTPRVVRPFPTRRSSDLTDTSVYFRLSPKPSSLLLTFFASKNTWSESLPNAAFNNATALEPVGGFGVSLSSFLQPTVQAIRETIDTRITSFGVLSILMFIVVNVLCL